MRDDWIDDWGPGARPRWRLWGRRRQRRAFRRLMGWTVTLAVFAGLAWVAVRIWAKAPTNPRERIVPRAINQGQPP